MADPHRIYIAKSMKSDLSVFTMVINLLTKYNVEVLQHVGSSQDYDPAIAASAESMILIPPTEGIERDYSWIGKGMYATLRDYFNDTPVHYDPVAWDVYAQPLIAFIDRDGALKFRRTKAIEMVQADWAIHWARVYTFPQDADIVSLFALQPMDKAWVPIIEQRPKPPNLLLLSEQ